MTIQTIKQYEDIPIGTYVKDVSLSSGWYRGIWIRDSMTEIFTVDIPKEYCVEA